MKIKSARISAMPNSFTGPLPAVFVILEGEGEEEHKLFDYYPDELSFAPGEFIGLTLEEARSLKYKKDRAYLGSLS